jgi:hypothetical protein
MSEQRSEHIAACDAKPSEKDHDLPGTRTRDLWSSSQHTQPLHHLGRLVVRLLSNLQCLRSFTKKKLST